VRWAEDYHLFILGALSFGAASLGRTARRQRWRNWLKLHITGMGLSYIFLLTAFYRRQRTQPAAFERTSFDQFLAVARRARDTAHCPCHAAASAGTALDTPRVASAVALLKTVTP